ncbi:hypothetical protein Q8F55_001363 [Vanrija albida]|uniref:Fe2OG dioxygenase domain-containing protein n=1 Tax=Vanrija albida TaxID=181172 RepID=A0ABR3QFT9_9TREE
MGFGADVYYNPSFIPQEEADQWYDQLIALETYNPTLTVYGKTITQSRAVAVYATTPGTSFKYSGAEIDVHYPLPPALRAMASRVEDALGVQFNHVMLNRYDDGGVYIGRHSDTRDNVIVASLSVGAERTFVMTPRLPPKASGIVVSPERSAELAVRQTKRWSLANGSLLVMQGMTQDFWKHEIPKEPKVKHGRISLTFRQLA